MAAAQARLTEAENERIFRQQVLPNFLSMERGASLPSQREAVVTGGQPGSGKTGLVQASAAELRARGATWVINGDDFYAYHPDYARLQRKHGADAAHMVVDEARQWVAKTLTAAQDRGVNLVLESTMRQPDLVQSTMQGLRAQGYRVEARVLAVKEQASWQGNHMRYEAIALNGGYPRLATRETHDAGAAGVVKTIAALEDRKLADRITLHRRNGQVMFDSAKTPKRSAAQALVAERERLWSKAEIAQHTQNWLAVEKMAARRHDRERTLPKRAAQEMAAIRTQRNADERLLTRQLEAGRAMPKTQAKDRSIATERSR